MLLDDASRCGRPVEGAELSAVVARVIEWVDGEVWVRREE